ncbi:protein FAR1-RELATED SEQUENCE 5-like [Coffea eugenioides]|uniref:protein FAR1-RELATED SEQUENCE 5-like n=1 Tax=Coffea eugenioides TaxID=49369 RepID=UPI000F60EE29|nr:protein FAR1-RELATED SEQUENCE 5-like [Coffea eugenioides]
MNWHEPSCLEHANEELEREQLTGSREQNGERGEMRAEAGEGVMQEEVMANNVQARCIDDLEYDQVMNMTFDSVEDAELFYFVYARAMGFGIRRSDRKYYDDGKTRYRKWLCCREGEREERWKTMENRMREAKVVTRVKCKACFRIKYDLPSSKFIVTEFLREHNHTLATPSTAIFLRAHRNVSDADYAHAYALRRVGTRTSQIMKLFALEAGGYDKVNFQNKDLYNKIERERKNEIIHGDAEGAIAYLQGKKDLDNDFCYKYHTDSENRLMRLFWADSQSLYDYKCFGEVLVFDSTYKTNDYNQPLVVLCGVNNHFSTCIFACCLVSNEDEEAFDWVLQTLVDANGGKKPISIITDGDPAMKKAIKNIIPEARHRLCSWHLQRNAKYNANKAFMKRFSSCMHNNWSPQRFEREWEKAVIECGIKDSEWVKSVYKKRDKWATAYLRDHFFAGMKSTQRCEKMNDVLKIHLTGELKLFEFMRAFDLGVAAIRHEENRLIAETEQTSLLPTTDMPWIEEHAAEIYTRNIFLIVRNAIKGQGMYNRSDLIDDGVHKIHFVEHSRENGRFRVQQTILGGMLACSCMMFETLGLPCTHMFRIMLLEGIERIPDFLIMKRWTRKAREEFHRGATVVQNVADDVTELARYGRLMAGCKPMCLYASKTDVGYERILSIIERETPEVRKLSENRRPAEPTLRQPQRNYGVKDPERARSKGSQRQEPRRRSTGIQCGKCGKRDGHNKRTCPLNTSNLDDNCSYEETDELGSDEQFDEVHYQRAAFGGSSSSKQTSFNDISRLQACGGVVHTTDYNQSLMGSWSMQLSTHMSTSTDGGRMNVEMQPMTCDFSSETPTFCDAGSHSLIPRFSSKASSSTGIPYAWSSDSGYDFEGTSNDTYGVYGSITTARECVVKAGADKVFTVFTVVMHGVDML